MFLDVETTGLVRTQSIALEVAYRPGKIDEKDETDYRRGGHEDCRHDIHLLAEDLTVA